MEKEGKLSPDIEQLIEQLTEENRALKEANAVLSEVIEGYDKELTSTTDMLEKTTNKLNMILDLVEKTDVNSQITSAIDSID